MQPCVALLRRSAIASLAWPAGPPEEVCFPAALLRVSWSAPGSRFASRTWTPRVLIRNRRSRAHRGRVAGPKIAKQPCRRRIISSLEDLERLSSGPEQHKSSILEGRLPPQLCKETEAAPAEVSLVPLGQAGLKNGVSRRGVKQSKTLAVQSTQSCQHNLGDGNTTCSLDDA